jgi:hypothetical protein
MNTTGVGVPQPTHTGASFQGTWGAGAPQIHDGTGGSLAKRAEAPKAPPPAAYATTRRPL